MYKSVIVCLLIVMLAATCLAQRDRGALTGIVTDSTGAAVSNVQITVTHTESGAVYKSATTDAGDYTVPNLPIGAYRMEFQAAGFKKFDRTGVPLS